MKVRVNKGTLEKAVYEAAAFTNGKGTMPILEDILIEADKLMGAVHITGSDLQIFFKTSVRAEIIEDGSACVSGERMKAFLKSSKAEVLDLEIKDEWLELKSDGVELRLPCLPSEDYPAWPNAEGEIICQVDSSELIKKINSVRYAVANDQTRYALNGILFELDKGEVVLVATDGHRIVKNTMAVRVQMAKAGKDEVSMILPAVLSNRVGVWAKNEEPLFIGQKGVYAEISSMDRLISARLIEGQFPNYRQVLGHKDHKISCKVNRERLLRAINQVKTVNGKDKGADIKLNIKEGLELIKSGDAGEIKVRVEAQTEGELLFGINGRYLEQMVNGAPANMVELKLKSPDDAVVYQSGGYEAVVMPMRV